jgi:hypothetical protein
MNKIFTCWRSTKIPILSLPLAVIVGLLPIRQAAASAVSASSKQPSGNSKIFAGIYRPQTPPTVSASPVSGLSAEANPPSVETLEAQSIAGARSVEVIEIRGKVTFKGRPAQIGDRLTEGDEIVTDPDSRARLAIDNNIGQVEVAENTAVRISSLEDTSGGQDTAVFVTRGRVRLSISKMAVEATPTANTPTVIPPHQIASLNSFTGLDQSSQFAQRRSSPRTAPVRVETPEGVAGVRGTSFGVSVGLDGKTGVETITGAVGVSGRTDSEVVVNPGYWTAIFPNTPPLAPAASPLLATLRVRRLSRLSSDTYHFSGQINPMDIVYVNGGEIKIDRQGNFKIQGVMPVSRRLKIVVHSPSVRQRYYELIVR